MKIKLEEYNLKWKHDFKQLQTELENLIGFLKPKIEHIGSTSVEGLSAKPIIDILIGLPDEKDLDKTVLPLIGNGYIYYEKYNLDMPYRRFFVKHKDGAKHCPVINILRREEDIPSSTEEHDERRAHIHIVPLSSEHWTRHIAFRDYLIAHPKIKEEYQKLKSSLIQREWSDGNDYNGAKDTFIKTEEKKAINWYVLR
ncbi:GrpB-like predicted nucleotidyltransferase (UPF0157 family) [Flavobacterium sp. 28YEA47A]|uniref:GrpB family protein n=1 Tax=Flavobacterium sp. 28YEA47A TaxID=3156276 RepID=UPI003516EDFF